MIEYKDIPKYCDRVDKDKRTTVVLSSYQAWLYKRLTQNGLKPLRGLARFFDVIVYAGLVVCVFVCARNLLLLSYFRRHNDSRADLVEFNDLHNGKVAVTFNPGEDEMAWGN
jgi:hypothetical protein